MFSIKVKMEPIEAVSSLTLQELFLFKSVIDKRIDDIRAASISVTEKEMDMIRGGKRIDAIRAIKTRTKISLFASKEIVDSIIYDIKEGIED